MKRTRRSGSLVWSRVLVEVERLGVKIASKTIECPFCGKVGQRSKEHVWAQWLHDTPGAQYLLAASHGERIPIEHLVLDRGPEGQLERTSATVGRYAKYLPNVTVPVCTECNSGWMSQLENGARAILKPLILDGQGFIKLTQDDLRLLAAWATKSWMAYSLTKSQVENIFSTHDYRSMVQDRLPVDRCRIWMLYSLGERAHVSIGITSTHLEFVKDPDYVPADMAEIPDNTGFALLAVAGCVFYMIRTPERFPDVPEQLMVPPSLKNFGSRQIWPSQRRQFFPLETMPDDAFEALHEYPKMLAEVIGMPTIGLTERDRQQVIQEFLGGTTPRELRAKWNPE